MKGSVVSGAVRFCAALGCLIKLLASIFCPWESFESEVKATEEPGDALRHVNILFLEFITTYYIIT